MKLAVSTAVTAVVLTLLATGLAEAQPMPRAASNPRHPERECGVKVRLECRAEVMGGMNYMDYWVNRTPEPWHTKAAECIRARGCVPRLQYRPVVCDWSTRTRLE
jgi:hypothetical protein